jgi:hypothetical protein
VENRFAAALGFELLEHYYRSSTFLSPSQFSQHLQSEEDLLRGRAATSSMSTNPHFEPDYPIPSDKGPVLASKTSHRSRATDIAVALAVLVALGIIFIGVREYFYPVLGARGFGVPLQDPRDSDLLAIKAGRDVATGILVLAIVALREWRFLAYTVAVLTLIPIFDGLVVLQHAGWTYTPFIFIHWGTAAVMLLAVGLLRARHAR